MTIVGGALDVVALAVAAGIAGTVTLTVQRETRWFAALRYACWKTLAARRGRTVTDDGADIAWLDAGHGPALVFLHGGGVDHGVFFAQLPRFARNHRVIAIDSRDHGASGRGAVEAGYARYAADVRTVLDALAIERAVLVGWSDGANTALVLALAARTRIDALVLMSPNATPDGLHPGAPPAAPVGRLARLGLWLYRRVHERAPCARRTAELERLWQNEPQLTAAMLGALAVPVIIIGGEYDLVTGEHLAALARSLPHAQLAILAGVGHGVPFEAPRRVNALLRAFLAAREHGP